MRVAAHLPHDGVVAACALESVVAERGGRAREVTGGEGVTGVVHRHAFDEVGAGAAAARRPHRRALPAHLRGSVVIVAPDAGDAVSAQDNADSADHNNARMARD